ncbi:alcohol dehydrogenase GroES-like domain-containing protein [Stachybotrys elegans]|uniref:Alcohol dehydrogenase GroES-like domain-containing protein n=1 Tax=Stachybotrys elegans TaxID=80388 RepID=A0A8K0T9K1_9HYPO|nr:alcohol dehydrogenase GroES-like domain-containing protein [Stachybotrys elegans]
MAAQHMSCLVQTPGGTEPAISHTQPIPIPKEPYDVLVRVHAVALNPTDFKIPEYHPVPGAILGCDFMGTVVAAGSAVQDAPPGTRICGAVHGSNPGNPSSGAFAEYLVVDSRVVLRVPQTWSDFQAAALGAVGWATMALTIEEILQLPGRPSSPAPPRSDGNPTPVLVFGGATASGTMACQLLSCSGYDPIVTASPASAALVKEYGAVKVVSYSSPTCGDTIRDATNGTLRHAIDCITNPESVRCCFTALGRIGARYACLDYALPEWRTRKSVKVDMPITYAMFGNEVQLKGIYHRDADPRKLDIAMRWCKEVQSLVDQGRLRCHPVREVPGKWQGIIQGLNMLKNGQVRREKLVVRIA